MQPVLRQGPVVLHWISSTVGKDSYNSTLFLACAIGNRICLGLSRNQLEHEIAAASVFSQVVLLNPERKSGVCKWNVWCWQHYWEHSFFWQVLKNLLHQFARYQGRYISSKTKATAFYLWGRNQGWRWLLWGTGDCETKQDTQQINLDIGQSLQFPKLSICNVLACDFYVASSNRFLSQNSAMILYRPNKYYRWQSDPDECYTFEKVRNLRDSTWNVGCAGKLSVWCSMNPASRWTASDSHSAQFWGYSRVFSGWVADAWSRLADSFSTLKKPPEFVVLKSNGQVNVLEHPITAALHYYDSF